jgi:hypothetical protein
MNKKLIYALVAIAFVFFVTSLVIFFKSRSPARYPEKKFAKAETRTETEEPRLLKVKAFFFTENSPFMIPVGFELERPPIKSELYKKFVDLIIQGKENFIAPIPPGLQLRTLYYVEKRKMLVLDFSDNLVSRFPSGSQSELEFIYFMVDNICFNFEEIKMVKFLVSGNEYSTISGHIDIENPFYPDYRYLRLD